MIFLLLRSHIYNILSYFFSGIVLIVGFPIVLIKPSCTGDIIFFWSKIMNLLMEWVVGVRYQIKGNSALPKECIVACKHQSAWETILAFTIFKNCKGVAKEELLKIPVYGFYVRKWGIVVSRSGGVKALKKLVSDCKKNLKEGNSIFIFPEGTRTHPGEKGEYQSGIAALYSSLGVPVVPVALNSGWFFPKRKILKYPGMITVQFLDPIEPGLSRKNFMNKLEASIESACIELDEDAKKQLGKFNKEEK